MNTIHKVAVLGAGTMGARIAAHFANAGVPCLLSRYRSARRDGAVAQQDRGRRPRSSQEIKTRRFHGTSSRPPGHHRQLRR